MGIIILILFIFLFEIRIKQYSSKVKLQMHIALLIYIVFSLILNTYLEKAYSWQYGIPGVDLTAHYEGAKAISQGIKITELFKISTRFDFSLSGFGYIIYAYFISLVSFSPIIISTKFSLEVLYIIQCIIAVISAINLADFFCDKQKQKNNVLIIFLTCICVAQMASVLMRDIWIVFFISILLYELKKMKPNKFKCIFFIILCALLRGYTIFITIPVFIMYALKKRKLSIVSSIAIFAIFIIGQGIITNISEFYKIKWSYDFKFDIGGIIRFILFPNIISQTYNVQHMITGYHSKFGGNTEWIYYMLSCWNLYVYPIAALGIYKAIKNKEKRYENIIWLFQIINISLLYSVFYDSISEPRHKLLILYGLIYFFIKGFYDMKKINKIIYFFLITMIIFILLLITS